MQIRAAQVIRSVRIRYDVNQQARSVCLKSEAEPGWAVLLEGASQVGGLAKGNVVFSRVRTVSLGTLGGSEAAGEESLARFPRPSETRRQRLSSARWPAGPAVGRTAGDRVIKE